MLYLLPKKENGSLVAGAVHLRNEWEVQILVLVSFALQVFLLMFAGMCRRSASRIPRIFLWLTYLLADSTAIYILGHMSLSSSKSRKHQQLVAFWAPFLLVHLGGQDTITAYAMEDNGLWMRHLLNLGVQVVGTAYVLNKYIAGSGNLVAAAVLMLVVGVLKYGERIWALKSSNLDSIIKILESVKCIEPYWMRGSVPQQGEEPHTPQWRVIKDGLSSEEVLQGAHNLLYISMAQFVSYKFWPSPSQCEAIKLFEKKGCIFGVFEMQLSLMHDILYTKAAVAHTWCGCCIRAFSLLATGAALALFLLQFSSTGAGYDHDKVDILVTYILLVGAFLLEIASTLRNIGSTWMCALLRSNWADQLHSKLVSLRCFVKAAESRAWPGSIGQPNSMEICGSDFSRKGWKWGTARLWNKLLYSSSTVISTSTKELVLKEIFRMAEACEGQEDIMKGYRGQCALKLLFEDPTWCTNGMDFDESILVWHIATYNFIHLSREAELDKARPIVHAINALSSYMMFLLLEHPYMLPSPVRPGLYWVRSGGGWS